MCQLIKMCAPTLKKFELIILFVPGEIYIHRPWNFKKCICIVHLSSSFTVRAQTVPQQVGFLKATRYSISAKNDNKILPFGAYTLTIHPPTIQPHNISTHIIRPPNETSALTIRPFDILTPMQTAQVFFCSSSFKVEVLSHVAWCPPVCPVTSCPTFCKAKCEPFVAWFLDTFFMSNQLPS
jgi:hypothetical protein